MPVAGSASTPVNRRGVRVTVYLPKGRVMDAAIAS